MSNHPYFEPATSEVWRVSARFHGLDFYWPGSGPSGRECLRIWNDYLASSNVYIIRISETVSNGASTAHVELGFVAHVAIENLSNVLAAFSTTVADIPDNYIALLKAAGKQHYNV